jgi:hypothetical protein
MEDVYVVGNEKQKHTMTNNALTWILL